MNAATPASDRPRRRRPSLGRPPARCRAASLTRPHMLRAWQRALAAYELRVEGLTFDQIAQRLGYAGRQGAAYAVASVARSSIGQEMREHVRVLHSCLLDKLLVRPFQRALEGDHEAVALALRIMDAQAKLNGLW